LDSRDGHFAEDCKSFTQSQLPTRKNTGGHFVNVLLLLLLMMMMMILL